MKFPTFRKTADFWFQESKQAELPGINIPLQTIVPEFDEMSKRNVVRVNMRDGASVRQKSSDPPEPTEKRQKVTHDFFLTKPPTPHPSEKDRTETFYRWLESSLEASGFGQPCHCPRVCPLLRYG